ncbi:MAG: hypothetical protein WEB88_17180 [Gemmatimonadota bacterium]
MRRSLLAVLSMAAMVPLLAGAGASGRSSMAGTPAAYTPAAEAVHAPSALRHLVLLVDGVPYEVMDSLQRAGHFRAFEPAGAVISTFPSLTGVAFQEIWGEPPAAGYEDRYYDAGQNRMAGGLLEHVMKGAADEGFLRHVEVEANPLTGGLTYVAPRLFGEVELEALRLQVEERAAWDERIVAYMVSTDALGHRAGREGMARFLVQVDTMLEGLRARYGPHLRIDLVSDHGNDLVPTRGAPLEEALVAGGLDPVKRLEEPGDVVLPRFGLVGAAFAFSAAEDRDRLAGALAGAAGVELVAWSAGPRTVALLGPGGGAVVQGDSAGARYRYLPTGGDPLGLAPALADMQARGVADAQGWAPDGAWLAASRTTPFLDGVRRLVEGLDDAVVNRATVVVSLAPGWHWGDPGAELLVNVTGTHGSLRTTSSQGMVMSTHLAAPALLRADEVAGLLELRR